MTSTMLSSTAASRIVDHTPLTDMGVYMIMALTLPQIETDAIGIHVGLGDIVRLTHAIKRRREGQWFFVTGTNSDEETFEELTLERLHTVYRLALSRMRTQVATANTATQAQWLVEQMTEYKLRSVELHAPWYHTARTTLTVIGAMMRRPEKEWFLVRSYPTPQPPSTSIREYLERSKSPQMLVTMEEMAHGEIDRILKYSRPKADNSPGDVATPDMLRTYVEWAYSRWEVKVFI